MMTNAQVALTAATETMQGLYPTMKSTYTAEDMAATRLALADIYLDWLEEDKSTRRKHSRDVSGRFRKKD